jgi:hypothetical protein
MDDNKKKKPLKTFVSFEGTHFDSYDLVRVKTDDKQFNADQPDGWDYNIVLYLRSYPNIITYSYATVELRESKRLELFKKLEERRIVFI